MVHGIKQSFASNWLHEEEAACGHKLMNALCMIGVLGLENEVNLRIRDNFGEDSKDRLDARLQIDGTFKYALRRPHDVHACFLYV